MSLTTPALVALSIVVYYVGLWVYSSTRLRRQGLRLPPGPRGWPIIGNVFEVPKVEPWVTYAAWTKIYGPIFSVTTLGERTVILNSGKAALDLLDGRASIYSDRPTPFSNMRPSVFGMPFMHSRFKSSRRLLQTGLNARTAKSYRPIQMGETQVFLNSLVNSPQDFAAHIRRNAVAVILKIAYGINIGGVDDPLIRALEENFEGFGILGASRWLPLLSLARFLPKRPQSTEAATSPTKHYTMDTLVSKDTSKSPSTWFDYLPNWGLIKFLRMARALRERVIASELAPFNTAKAQIAKGEFVESFTSKHLLPEDGSIVDKEVEEDILYTSAALYVGGGDTTVSGLISFFLLMALHPEVQQRAQAEVDSIAVNRLPTIEDYESMPYVRAIIKEVVRWGPVAPLGLRHRVMEDDVYEDFFIPKGSHIVANIWAITHDEELYPNPHTFDPSRHLGEKHQPDPWKYVFGFGRRTCPGAHLAEMSLFLNITNVLSVFKISKAVNEKGIEVEPEVHWNTGVTMHLKNFEVSIKPRSAEKLALLEKFE